MRTNTQNKKIHFAELFNLKPKNIQLLITILRVRSIVRGSRMLHFRVLVGRDEIRPWDPSIQTQQKQPYSTTSTLCFGPISLFKRLLH